MCDLSVEDIIKREVAKTMQEVIRPMLEDVAHAAAQGTIKALKDEGIISHQVLKGWKHIAKYVDGSSEFRNIKPLLNFGLPVAIINGKAYSSPDAIQLWLYTNIEHQVKSRQATIEKKAKEAKIKREIQEAKWREEDKMKKSHFRRNPDIEEDIDAGDYFKNLPPKK